MKNYKFWITTHPLYVPRFMRGIQNWIIPWGLLVILFSISLPGFGEFDATKYSIIAKQMMTTHQYLIAYWDGHFYSDKPPLLFWLMIGGWKIFGITPWWPQCLVLLIATTSIIVTQRISQAFWPDDRSSYRLLPFILIGCFYWVWFAKQIRVDSMLVLATLLSILCSFKATEQHIRSGSNPHYWWLGYALSVTLGIFAKGPVIFIFILLPILAYPMLSDQRYSGRWLILLGLYTLLGLCLPLAWAIPAMLRGDATFAHEIAYQQITQRIHTHHESTLFYLLRLPAWLLPWSLYPPVWQGLKTVRFKNRGQGICILAITEGMIALSLFNQKLPHYLYPLFPLFALLIAHAISHAPHFKHRHIYPYTALLILLASFCIAIPHLWSWLPPKVIIRGYFLRDIPLTCWGLIFGFIATGLFLIKINNQTSQVIMISLSSLLIAFFVNHILIATYQKHCYFDRTQPPPHTWYYETRYSIHSENRDPDRVLTY